MVGSLAWWGGVKEKGRWRRLNVGGGRFGMVRAERARVRWVRVFNISLEE